MKHDDEFRPVAEIPLAIVGQLMREGRWNDPAAMKRWLNDPDNAFFRIQGGRV
jgi:mRNA-degrading endonuclease HigB of HigAB toxin-antitoxin module